MSWGMRWWWIGATTSCRMTWWSGASTASTLTWWRIGASLASSMSRWIGAIFAFMSAERWIGAIADLEGLWQWIGTAAMAGHVRKEEEAWIGTMLEVTLRFLWTATCWMTAWLYDDKEAMKKIRDKFQEYNIDEHYKQIMKYVREMKHSILEGNRMATWKDWFQRRLACEKSRTRRLSLGRGSSPRRKKLKWDGTLRKQWTERKQWYGLLLLSLVTSGHAMDQQQAGQIFTRMLDLSTAATEAARSTASAMDLLQKQAELKGDMGPKFADASGVLRQPDAFEVDDPIKLTLWREQFLNWLCFSDSRYGDLVKLAEESLDDVDENEFNEETKDLSQRLYSILVSYLSSSDREKLAEREEWIWSLAEAEAALRSEDKA